MSQKEHKFCAYDSFKKQLTVTGYIKEQFKSIPYHPTDIVSLIFQYYHTFILELQYFNYIEETSTNKKKVITVEKYKDIWVRPSTSAQWAIRSTSPINNLSLQYEFSVKCIENMSNNNVFIGIAPFNQLQHRYLGSGRLSGSNDTRCRYYRDVNGNYKCDVVSPYERYNGSRTSAYFLQNSFNSYRFLKQTNWWKRSIHSSMQCIKRTSAPMNFNKNDVISLTLNCEEWKLSFYINNIFINSVEVGKDVIYSPVILFNECPKVAKCEIISMKCSLVKDERSSNRKHFDERDLNEYIFVCIKAKSDYHTGYELILQYLATTEPHQSEFERYACLSGIERQMQSKNAIFGGLYKGKKILFCESDNLANLIVAMKHDRYNFHLWIIIEIYMYFCEQYKTLLLSCVSNEKISGIITDFVFENFDTGYEEYNKNNGMLRNLMCFKWDKWIKNDPLAVGCNESFEQFMNKTVLHYSRMEISELDENNLPTNGIYSGINMRVTDYYDGYTSDYYDWDYLYSDYYEKMPDYFREWHIDFEAYKENNNFYQSVIVKQKCNNSHRKRKRKEKKKIKYMKKENKKKKRIELNTYVKKYSLVY